MYSFGWKFFKKSSMYVCYPKSFWPKWSFVKSIPGQSLTGRRVAGSRFAETREPSAGDPWFPGTDLVNYFPSYFTDLDLKCQT
jgi:hypothetical protein